MIAVFTTLLGAQDDVGSLTVTCNPASINESASSSSHTTASVLAQVSGGSGSYDYLWQKMTNDYPLMLQDSPTASSTTFSTTGMAISDVWYDTFRVTVTDQFVPARTGYANILITVVRFS